MEISCLAIYFYALRRYNIICNSNFPDYFDATPYTMTRNYKKKMDLLKASVSHIEYL